jgi:hypothetical protein
MATQRFKVPLNNAVFPYISTKAPRAVFVPGLDAVPAANRNFTGATGNVDNNLAQIVYGENFMPSTKGVKSVGYRQLIAPTVNTDFDSIFALRDADENTVLYSPAAGQNYIYDSVAEAWSSDPIESVYAKTFHATSDPATSRVTYAYVDGFTFICFSRLKSDEAIPTDMSLMAWDTATQTLIPATALLANTPFAAGTIDGVCGAAGYLIMWSGIEIAWAPFAATAFDFSSYANGAYTGAGRQVPEDVQGNIRAIIPAAGGFIAFTDKNAIGASYAANNLLSPWIFREIPEAGGLESYEQSTVEGSLGAVYAYTTAGMQRITLNQAESQFPDLSDFLAGRQIERYRFDLQELYQGSTTLDFYTKVTAVGNRYLVVSYGTFPGIYSYALVYDLQSQRWGKLRMVHRDCFYYNYGAEVAGLTYAMLGDVAYDSAGIGTYASTSGQSNAFTAAPHSLAFLKDTGEVVIANWSDQVRDSEDAAVVVIGRVQLSRSRNTQLNRVEIEGLVSGHAYVTPSYDGRNLETSQELTVITDDNDYKLMGTMVDCKNFNIIVSGTFDLSTLILEAVQTGAL